MMLRPRFVAKSQVGQMSRFLFRSGTMRVSFLAYGMDGTPGGSTTSGVVLGRPLLLGDRPSAGSVRRCSDTTRHDARPPERGSAARVMSVVSPTLSG
jgi:hypothetical protein